MRPDENPPERPDVRPASSRHEESRRCTAASDERAEECLGIPVNTIACSRKACRRRIRRPSARSLVSRAAAPRAAAPRLLSSVVPARRRSARSDDPRGHIVGTIQFAFAVVERKARLMRVVALAAARTSRRRVTDLSSDHALDSARLCNVVNARDKSRSA